MNTSRDRGEIMLKLHHLKNYILIFSIFVLMAGSLSAGDTGSAPIRLVVISDRAGSPVDNIYDDIVLEIERLRPDLVVSVGDQIDGVTDDEEVLRKSWAEFYEIIKPLTMPFYFCAGNNDIFSETTDKLYRELVAEPYYSFDYNNAHFVVLDNSTVDSPDEISAEQYAWLEQDLSKHTDAAYTLAFMHKPFWYQFRAKNKPDKLHDLFVKYGVDAVFTGHYHEYFTGEYDGIKYTGMGSSGGGIGTRASMMDYHYAWVTLDSEGIHIAPIKYQSVVDWDETTVEDKQAFDIIKNGGFYCKAPLGITDAFTLDGNTVTLTVDNSTSAFELNDTIKWSPVEGWNIEPVSMAVTVPAGQKREFGFQVGCDKFSWLLPSAKLNFKCREDKSLQAQCPLWIARTADCSPIVGEFELDGKLDEDFWSDQTLKLYSPTGDSNEADPTIFDFHYDNDYLYIGAKCFDEHIDSLAAKNTDQDGPVYAEDCIGMFIEPVAGSGEVYQIYANALGAVYDNHYYRDAEGWMSYNTGWTGQYDIATFVGDNYWSIEMRIPLSQFKTSAGPDTTMNLNFRRKQKRLNTAADWQVPISSNPRQMGVLIFE